MSNIDEIMGAVGRHGDDCIRDGDAASESFDGLREMIAAALADAERAGAEAMREAAAAEFDRRDGGTGIGFYDPHEPAEIVRALPLPTGPRQAVLLTDEQIDGLVGRHWGDTGVAMQSVADFAARVQAAVIAANGLEVLRG